MIVEVLDRMCGSGKTTAILEWIPRDVPFIFVTPLLSECEERVGSARSDLDICTPEAEASLLIGGEVTRSKSSGLLRLLREGRNIAITHQLLRLTVKEHWDEMRSQGYMLIIDEELCLIESLDGYTLSDKRWLIESGSIKLADSGQVEWCSDSGVAHDFKYSEVKGLCEKGLVWCAKRSSQMLVLNLPREIISAASRCIVMSYMFKGSVLDSWLQMNGFETKPFEDVSVRDIDVTKEIKPLIHMLNTNKLRKSLVGVKFSQSGWARMSSENVRTIELFCENIARRGATEPVTKEEFLYSVPKANIDGDAKRFSPKRLSHGKELVWANSKLRATNTLSHKKMLVYGLDVYPNTSVEAFFVDRGFPIDREVYALSQLIQWLWRGCVRNGEDMWVGILSERMENLFTDWLEGK